MLHELPHRRVCLIPVWLEAMNQSIQRELSESRNVVGFGEDEHLNAQLPDLACQIAIILGIVPDEITLGGAVFRVPDLCAIPVGTRGRFSSKSSSCCFLSHRRKASTVSDVTFSSLMPETLG